MNDCLKELGEFLGAWETSLRSTSILPSLASLSCSLS